mmetsp:Transcript_21174/g.44459  ORF Transcript_21174/g.44459 Transcript_21174/m.44459 type:complete len:141 (-) Transcript_21174:372-794(-)
MRSTHKKMSRIQSESCLNEKMQVLQISALVSPWIRYHVHEDEASLAAKKHHSRKKHGPACTLYGTRWKVITKIVVQTLPLQDARTAFTAGVVLATNPIHDIAATIVARSSIAAIIEATTEVVLETRSPSIRSPPALSKFS